MKKLIKNNLVLLLFFVSFAVVLIVGVYSGSMMISSAQLVQDSTEKQMVALSEAASLLVTAEELDEFVTVEDMQKPEYDEMKRKLSSFTERAGIMYTYYMRLDPQTGKMQFIIDNVLDPADEPDGLDSEQQEREDGPDIALKGRANAVNLGDYSTGWDGLVTGWAPMYYSDGSLSNMVAGVDMQDVFIRDARDNMYNLTIVLTLSISVGLLTSFICLMLYRKKAEEFEIASEAKSNFLSRMSHEMRTPMNAIVGMSEMLMREDLPSDAQRHAIGIKQASANLLSIINDVLNLSKIESGTLEIVNSNYFFASVLNDVINIIRMRVMGKPIRFLTYIDASLPSEMVGDEVRIRQILINLLGNAAKYTEEGFISLSVTGEKRQNGSVVLQFVVEDSGIGIKEEDQEKLFENFVQVNTRQTKGVEGTGLGLSIAKSMSEAMGGNISLTSEYQKGSTFTVCIPQKVAGKEPLASVEDANKKEILLFEMRDMCGKSIAESFDSLGIHYTWVKKQSEFSGELSKNGSRYTHIFLPYVMLESLPKLSEFGECRAKIVAMVDYEMNSISKEVEVIQMPVHVLSIANVLNEQSTKLQYTDGKEHFLFVAPSARVLLVDDINTNLTVAEGLLLPYKMQIDKAKSGEQALELVQKNNYDIVFMDHMMPGMDGIEATERIRAMESEDGYYQKLPIVAMTANAVSGMKEIFLDSGMNDYLAKPIEMPKLVNILEKWIPTEKQEAVVSTREQNPEHMPGLGISGVNEQAGIAMTGGSAQAYQRILQTFYTDGFEKIKEIKAALAQEDYRLYTTYVHALKSALAGIGAKSLSEDAKALEAAGRREDVSYIDRHNMAFLQELGELLDEISDTVGQRESPQQQGDGETLRGRLLELQEYLSELDIVESERVLSGLLSERWDEKTEWVLREVENNIIVAKYDEAAELINELL